MEQFERDPEEVEINLKRLLFDILRKWKVILAWGLIGILLGLAINLLSNQEITLDDVDMDNVLVEQVADYAATHEMMNYQLEYEAESPLMQIDPENAYEVSLHYYITAHSTDIELISLQFNNILSDDSIRKELYDLSGLTCHIKYLNEIISSSYSLSNGLSVELNNIEDLQFIPRNSQLSFHIWAQNEEQAQTLLSALKKHIDQIDYYCQQTYEDYSLQLVNEQHSNGRSDSLINLHQNAVDTKLSYADIIEEYEKTLTDDEKSYAKIIYNIGIGEPSNANSIKMVLLLTVVIEIIVIVYLLVRSIFNRKVRSYTQLNDLFNLYHVAHLESPCKYKGINAWLYHLEHKNDLPAVSREYLLQTFNMLDTQKLIVCGDRNDATLSELADWLAAACNKVQSIGSLHQDDNALAAAKNADGIVFLVRIDQTTRDEVKRNLDICRQMNFPVIGAVTIE